MSSLTESFTYENDGFASPPGWARVTTSTDARNKTTTHGYTSHAGNAALATGNVVHALKFATITNPLGHVTTNEFDLYGHHVSTVDPNGRVAEACYDRQGRLAQVFGYLDPKPTGDHFWAYCNGSVASRTYTYTPIGLPLPTPTMPNRYAPDGSLRDFSRRWVIRESEKFDVNTDGTGRFVESWTTLDGLGRAVQNKTQAKDGSGGVVVARTLFDSVGRVSRQSEPFQLSGATLDATYHGMAAASIPVDHDTRYDFAGRVKTQYQRDNDAVHHQVDTSYVGTATIATAPYNGSNPYGTTATNVDAYGRTWKVVENDSVGGAAETRYRYFANDNVQYVYQPGSSNDSSMTYNFLGQQTTLDDNEAGSSSTTYYQNGAVATATDTQGRVVIHVIDWLGRPLHRYAGSVALGNLLTSNGYDPAGNKGALWYSYSHQPRGVPAFLAETIAFDGAGRPTKTQATVFAANDPLVANDELLDDTITLETSYLVNGLIDKVTLPGRPGWSLTTNEVVTNTYNTAGLLQSSRTDAGVGLFSQSYNPIGQPVVSNLRAGFGQREVNITTTYRDSDNRMTARTATLYGSEEKNGRLVVNDQFSYDRPGNLTSVLSDPDDTPGDERECFYYDQRQRLTRAISLAATAGSCPTTATATTPTGGAAPYNDGYSYNLQNDITNMDGRAYSYATNVAGEQCTPNTDDPKPKAVSTIGAGNGQPSETLSYNCAGSISSRVKGTGATADVWSYAWDDLNRLVSTSVGKRVTWQNLTNMAVEPATGDLYATAGADGVTYSAGASSVDTITGDGSLSFRIPNNGQLPVNQQLPRQLVGLNNGADASTAYNENEYQFYVDQNRFIYIYENGALIAPPGGNQYWFNHYDNDDIFTIQRIGTEVYYLRNGTRFYKSLTPATGTYRVDTAFMHPGTRTAEVTLTQGTTLPSRNVYDAGGQRVLRVDPNGTKTIYLGATELRWTPGSTTVNVARTYAPGVRRDFDGTLRYSVTNHQNTIDTTVDTTTGTINHNHFAPYGTTRTGTLNDDKGFLNQTHDPNTLIYLNNRHYDPSAGVFISVDPLVTITGEPYIYGSANPVTMSDPSGLEPCPKAGCSAEDSGGRLPIARHAIPGQPGRGDFSDCAHSGQASYCNTASTAYQQQTNELNRMSARNECPTCDYKDLTAAGYLLGGVACVYGACPIVGAGRTAQRVFQWWSWRQNASNPRNYNDRGYDEVPSSWGPGRVNQKGPGRRWEDPRDPGNGIRIDKGNPNSSFPSQQVNHVIVRYGGEVVGRNGQPLPGSIKQFPELAHIPLEEWLSWTNWFTP